MTDRSKSLLEEAKAAGAEVTDFVNYYYSEYVVVFEQDALSNFVNRVQATERLRGRIKDMMETTFRILRQGDVYMAHCKGYMMAGGDDAVCFYIDPRDRAYISASTTSDKGCPVVARS